MYSINIAAVDFVVGKNPYILGPTDVRLKPRYRILQLLEGRELVDLASFWLKEPNSCIVGDLRQCQRTHASP